MKTKGLMALALAAVVTFSGAPLNVVHAAEDVPIDDVHFPDDIFREYVSGTYDWDRDGFLTENELKYVTSISVGKRGITDLTGIECFKELKNLDCQENKLTSLDLSENTALEELYCDNNLLTGLDLSGNTQLDTLSCNDNQLTGLDLRDNTKLQKLWCENNSLATIGLGGNTELWALYCNSNQLTGLDVSRNTLLNVLECKDNKLTMLDLSNNKDLRKLYALGNYLTQVDVSAITNYVTLQNDAPFIDTEKGVLVYSEEPAPGPEPAPVIVDKTIRIGKKATLKAKKKIAHIEISGDSAVAVIKIKGKKVTVMGVDEGISTIIAYDKNDNYIRDWLVQVK